METNTKTSLANTGTRIPMKRLTQNRTQRAFDLMSEMNNTNLSFFCVLFLTSPRTYLKTGHNNGNRMVINIVIFDVGVFFFHLHV